MTRPMILTWIERGLLAAGIALGAWSAAVYVEGRFFSTLPPPPVGGSAAAEHRSNAPGVTVVASIPPGSWLARLDAPSVQLSAAVLEGSDDETLGRSAGHIEDTPFPGQPGNIGIAGHRDTTFRAVRHLRLGDPLVLTTSDRVYRYEITRTFVVNPDDVYVLDPSDHPILTLVTCYPFEFIGHAPHRYIIQASLVGQPEARF
jgi:sortase A